MVGLDFSTFNNDHERLRTRSPLNDSGKRKNPQQAVHLPHDIIHLIVRRFFRYNADVFPVWNYGDHAIRNAHLRQQKLLPLAAVNSMWRRVVTPFLYMSIVCEETKIPASHSGYNYSTTDNANHCYWRTNLGLFDSSSSKWARRIFVLSSNNGANIESLILALTMQGFVNFSWPGISSLHLAILSTSICERNSIPEPIVVIHSTKLARNCPAMLPISDIGYSGLNGLCAFICSVIKRMQYNNDASLPSGSSQLLAWNNENGHPAQNGISRVSLGFPPPPPLSSSSSSFVVTSLQQPRRSIQLSRLKIRYYDMLVDLVAQLSPSLYDLGISDIPQVGILDVLCLGELVPELKSLSLEFAGGNAHLLRPAGQNRISSAMNLISPYQEAGLVEVRPLYRLCQLRVKNYPHDIMDCLFSLVRGQHLDHIHIETPSISTVRNLDSGMSCLRVRSFSLACIGNVHTSGEDAKALISTILSEPSSSCMEYLRISLLLQNAVRLEPGPLSSSLSPSLLVLLPNLRSLSLRAPISLEHLTTIISQMPRLRTVKAPYISTAATISPPGTPQTIEELWKQLRQNNQSATISTSIECMTLGFWDHQQNSRQLCCQILAFVARIPSILSLVHTDESFAPTLRWTTDCLIVLADSIGGLFGRIPDHMRDLVISNNLGAVRSFS